MSKKRFSLVVLLSLAWMGMLAGGDCDVDLHLGELSHFFDDGHHHDDGYYYDEIIYDDFYYDPYYPCCY
jgi:hypothetical protein